MKRKIILNLAMSLDGYIASEDGSYEWIVGIIPTISGNVRPLFLNNNPKIDLHLDQYIIEKGIVILRYSKR